MDTFDPGRAVTDLLTVRRAFGDPITQDGVTVIPVAKVMGGSGGGSGTGPGGRRADGAGDAEASGSGGGLGVRVRPMGVYVVDGTQVTWRPALDVQRIIAGGQVVAALTILTVLVGLLRRRR